MKNPIILCISFSSILAFTGCDLFDSLFSDPIGEARINRHAISWSDEKPQCIEL